MKTTRWLGIGLVSFAACNTAVEPTSPDLALSAQLSRGSSQANLSINVLLDRPATDAMLVELGAIGRVTDQIVELDAVMLRARAGDLSAIRALPYVLAANPDAERGAGPPMPPLPVSDFAGGLSTWDLDAIGVTDYFLVDNMPVPGRAVAEDGEGVYVAVLDTGLLDSWPFYFPTERIAVQYARSFTGGPVGGTTASQPNKWEHDVQAHGTHVTSTILGYNLNGTPVNGVAPRAKVIPVKVLNNSGGGWSSTIAHGIVYVADLKAGPLAGSPLVINMSLGGSQLDAVEQAAIDYAIAKGVIVVASAGNRGTAGMGYPGAYAPVISVGAAGWAGQWTSGSWFLGNVADPTNPLHFYIADFSGRELGNQDLDVIAPGSWVVGPYQVNRGQTSYFYLSGTSMASPHVAGIVALMAQVDPTLSASDAEDILESTALPITHTARNVLGPTGAVQEYTWKADAVGSGLVSATAAITAAGS